MLPCKCAIEHSCVVQRRFYAPCLSSLRRWYVPYAMIYAISSNNLHLCLTPLLPWQVPPPKLLPHFYLLRTGSLREHATWVLASMGNSRPHELLLAGVNNHLYILQVLHGTKFLVLVQDWSKTCQIWLRRTRGLEADDALDKPSTSLP